MQVFCTLWEKGKKFSFAPSFGTLSFDGRQSIEKGGSSQGQAGRVYIENQSPQKKYCVEGRQKAERQLSA